MRRIILSLAAGLALLASPALAQTWSAPNNTGIVIESSATTGKVFGGDFRYDSLGASTFLTFDQNDFDSTHANGVTYQPRGGSPIGTAAGSCVKPTQTAAGNVRLTFATPRSGTVQRNDGATETLDRTIIDTANPYAEPTPGANYITRGWYWNPSCDGQGAHVEVSGDWLYLLYFAYENGSPVWYYLHAALIRDTTHATSSTSGPLNKCSRATGSTVCTSVQNISVQFSTNTRFVITWANGVTLTLQPFDF